MEKKILGNYFELIFVVSTDVSIFPFAHLMTYMYLTLALVDLISSSIPYYIMIVFHTMSNMISSFTLPFQGHHGGVEIMASLDLGNMIWIECERVVRDHSREHLIHS